MAGRIKVSFHMRVLISLLALCGILIGTFMIFQYHREKEFRTELLNTRLQMVNLRVIDYIYSGEDLNLIVPRLSRTLKGLRLTVIDCDGRVLFDNNDSTPFPISNHNNRPEIIKARESGTGYIVERYSESDNTDYFYSAMLSDDDTVVRTAVPYNHSLQSFLSADRTFLWVMGLMTVAVCIIGFIITRRISISIANLNKFAEKAENGHRIFDEAAFPNDELGSIASHIVRLYVQRDQQHHDAIEHERDKIRIKKQLTNNINHELKTPVTSILVCADLLNDHPELPEKERTEFIGRIRSNARRLTSMLQDVSTITRMDDGADKIEMEPVEIAKLVQDVVADEQAKAGGMTINVCVPDITINGNRTLLESLFRNLLDNAVAYSGGSEITISADANGNFTFRDNGIGIEEKHLPYIFERFYRIDKGRSRLLGGTGLGLAIVKNAVAIHGGSIKAKNDNGLRFDFNIS